MIKAGEGTYTSFYPDNTSIYETGNIKNGFREGLWKEFFMSTASVSKELIYVHGKLNGTQKFFYQTGELYSEGEMVNDKREGEWKWYFENGRISSTVKFVKGKKEGKQVMWSESGEKLKEEYYENGILIREKNLKD